MSGTTLQKIFAAVLVAGIIAMLAGFVAKRVVHVEAPEKNAFPIEVTEAAEGGPAAAAGPEPILALLAGADVAKGEAVSKACAACHDFTKGGANKVGPNLYNIINNHHAHAEGFAYSEAMVAVKDQTWGYQEMNAFLWSPQKHIKGTKMTFAGLKKPADRANIIAWLRTVSDTPAPLPTEAEIAAEAPKEEAAADAAKTGDVAPEDTAKVTPEGKTPAEANPAAAKGSDGPAKDAPVKGAAPAAEKEAVKQAPAKAE